jgi:hypothetical protein
MAEQRESTRLDLGRERHDVERRDELVDLRQGPQACGRVERSPAGEALDREATFDAGEECNRPGHALAEGPAASIGERGLAHHQRQQRRGVPELHGRSTRIAVFAQGVERVGAATHRRTQLVEGQRLARCGDEHAAPDQIVPEVLLFDPLGGDRTQFRDRCLAVHHEQARPVSNDAQVAGGGFAAPRSGQSA